MGDGRSNRKAKVIPFIDRLERDRKENLETLVCKAKQMNLEGFESVNWDDAIWQITGGRLVMITGRNSKSSTFSFSLPQKLGAYQLFGSWKEVAKALFVLRFHRKHQSTSSTQFYYIYSLCLVFC